MAEPMSPVRLTVPAGGLSVPSLRLMRGGCDPFPSFSISYASAPVTAVTCPSCGAQAAGKFCRSCGASLGGQACGRCGGALAPQARFCAQCGQSAASPVTGGNARLVWFLIGAAVTTVLGGSAWALSRGSGPPPAEVASTAVAPFAAGGAGGTPPDISNMSPRERFDRLFDRVMRAAESGDEATVTNFSPMALQAYTMLDTVDADARYHAALIRLHTGDVDGAGLLADSILKSTPGHLFGYIVQGTIARFKKDNAGLSRSYAAFLSHYDAEVKAARPEYQQHKPSLDEFHRAATEAKRP